ncbi:hypothetical protein LCGC14_2910000, partial [marine sediment metagenome]
RGKLVKLLVKKLKENPEVMAGSEEDDE